MGNSANATSSEIAAISRVCSNYSVQLDGKADNQSTSSIHCFTSLGIREVYVHIKSNKHDSFSKINQICFRLQVELEKISWIGKAQVTSRLFREEIRNNFQSTCNQQIKGCVPLKNYAPYSLFDRENTYEQILENKCKKYGKKRFEIEQFVWHGTSYEGIKNILNKGFDRDYNTTSAYGRGTYFAKNASYSVSYSPVYKYTNAANSRKGGYVNFRILDNEKDSGCRFMLLCKIIMGRCMVGKSSMKEIPNGYDSLVNSTSSPTIFVIHKDYHAIPVYLIKFK